MRRPEGEHSLSWSLNGATDWGQVGPLGPAAGLRALLHQAGEPAPLAGHQHLTPGAKPKNAVSLRVIAQPLPYKCFLPALRLCAMFLFFSLKWFLFAVLN